ncbi:hypothetical protein SDC9_180394 [bioreactor metagenome]|uniref:Uncharacterized protein n=1 Tax=bioreactor metagenome TaxID=1076179 RepID=A0A645H1M7_9ZZZZ
MAEGVEQGDAQQQSSFLGLYAGLYGKSVGAHDIAYLAD